MLPFSSGRSCWPANLMRFRINLRSARAALLALALLAGAQTAAAQTIAGFVHRKVQNFEQTSPAAPVASSAEPFQFGSIVSKGFATINSATLTFNGSASPRAYQLSTNSNFSILDTFATQAQLEAAYGSGTYNLSVNTTAGVFSRSIFFSPFSYPTTPELTVAASDWQNGELLIDAAADYTLTWGAFSNAEAADLIEFTILNPSVSVRSFPPTQTSYTLPAGTLVPNRFYLCDLAFIRAAGATARDANIGPGSARLMTTTRFHIRTRVAPLTLLSAVSQKPHGLDTGFFDLPLPLSGPPGVECRSGGSNGFHTLVFTFNNVLASGSASVTSGTGNIAFAPSFVSDRMNVRLNGVADAQTITVTLRDVTDQHGQVLPETAVSLNVLLGDGNGDKTVNSGDAQQTRNRSGQPLTGSTFRSDFNLDNSINSGDATIARSRSGQFIP